MTPIDHVQIAIPAGGEHAARGFYTCLSGLGEVEKPENLRAGGGLWLQSGTLQLHLGIAPEFRPARKAHVAFRVADLEVVRAQPESAGFPTREEEALPGFRRFYVDDPFANRTEFVSPERALQG